MKLPGRGFWVGLATGSVLMAGVGFLAVLWTLNQSAKHSLDHRAILISTVAHWVNGLRVRVETGDPEKIDAYHRSIAWSLHREQSVLECVTEKDWILTGETGCEPAFTEDSWQIPEDWAIPGLEQKREIYERASRARQEQTDTTH